ncbi:hypothetical protein RHAB21_00827 [Pseudorhizobium halotolerans]|uniref:Uncharacterized protein n=1 Tax=Pseudorhizobium halotolerans TaxID=1233081 RepID=A0ABM8PZ78_9HYPH|nr:hypothetical protein [Pseudorhizobium halotolerans]CAD7055948.1 hypothetical protein RHAB21_00827 [Pseudorhizobium halotolerans]
MAFEDDYHFSYITTDAKVAEYEASHDVFASLLDEVKELSKKKPDASMSAGKVKIVNRVLDNLLVVLEGQPDAKYLDTLDDDDLPQVSDAVLVMVQFKSALASFRDRHYQHVPGYGHHWITAELIEHLKDEYKADDEQET